MRLQSFSVLVWSFMLVLVPGVLGQVQTPSSTLSLSSLPICAVQCLETSVANSTCSATDIPCLCTNAPLQETITACVRQSCRVKDQLIAKNATQTLCHAPIRDSSGTFYNVDVILGIVTGVLVAFRVGFKLVVIRLGLDWDDWFVIASLFVGIPGTILGALGTVTNGLGKDIWTLTPTQITNFGRFFYASELLYFSNVPLLKMSLLCFFLRIFPAPGIRRIIFFTMGANGLFGIAFLAAAIFQCTPISFFWDKWDGEHRGTCMDINALAWANAALSIALDVWMLGIPLSQLPALRLHWKKKIGVGMMFCVGAFVTVVSILRLQSLVTFANSSNPTWDNLGVSVWSTIELNVGIICACMPIVRLALVRLFPSLKGTTRRGYYGNNLSHNLSRGGGGLPPRVGGPVGSAPQNVRIVNKPPTAPMVNKPPQPPTTPKSTTPSENSNWKITYQKSFAVQYSDNDEASLVQMKDLDLGNRSHWRDGSY